jgi:hypothetical protein
MKKRHSAKSKHAPGTHISERLTCLDQNLQKKTWLPGLRMFIPTKNALEIQGAQKSAQRNNSYERNWACTQNIVMYRRLDHMASLDACLATKIQTLACNLD